MRRHPRYIRYNILQLHIHDRRLFSLSHGRINTNDISLAAPEPRFHLDLIPRLHLEDDGDQVVTPPLFEEKDKDEEIEEIEPLWKTMTNSGEVRKRFLRYSSEEVYSSKEACVEWLNFLSEECPETLGEAIFQNFQRK